MINALPELSPLITMSFGGRNFTGQEIREIIELAHVSYLASHCSRLFAVLVTKYKHTLYSCYFACCFESNRPRVGDPRGLTSGESLMADGTAIGRSHAEKKSHDETGSQIMKPWLLFYNYYPQRTSLPRTNSLPSDLIMISVAQLLCTNPSFLNNLTLLSMVHLSFSHLNLCRTQAIVQPMQG